MTVIHLNAFSRGHIMFPHSILRIPVKSPSQHPNLLPCFVTSGWGGGGGAEKERKVARIGSVSLKSERRADQSSSLHAAHTIKERSFPPREMKRAEYLP